MDAIVVGSLIILWDFLKPTLIVGFYLLLFIATFKLWILDDITKKLDEAVSQLKAIERQVGKDDITKKLDEAVSQLKAIERQVGNIHIEMSNIRGWVENIERAGIVHKQIYDDLNNQIGSGFVSSSRSQKRYSSGSFKDMTDFEKNLKR